MRPVIITFFFFIFVLISCEEVIEVDLPEAPPRLVIEAVIEKKLTPEGDLIEDIAEVKLSLTTPFFGTEPNLVDDAVVRITEVTSRRRYILNRISPGIFRILNSDFSINEDAIFNLEVVYNNEIYTAEAQVKPSTPFTDICQVVNPNPFDENGVAVEVAFNDIPNEPNFYFLDLGDNNFATIDDEFFEDGKEIKFTFFFDENVTLNHLFQIYGSDQRFNNYVDAITNLASGSSNGPFATVPFQAKGNIINTTNANNFPFGYFRAAESYDFRLQLVPNRDFIPKVPNPANSPTP